MFTPAPAWLELLFGLGLVILLVFWVLSRTLGWMWDGAEDWWITRGPGARRVKREVASTMARRRTDTAQHLHIAGQHLGLETSSPEYGQLQAWMNTKAFDFFHGAPSYRDELPDDFGIRQADSFWRSWSALSDEGKRRILHGDWADAQVEEFPELDGGPGSS